MNDGNNSQAPELNTQPAADNTDQQPFVAPVTPQQADTQPQAPAEPTTPQNSLSDVFDQIAEKIIEQQEAIIGPIAVERAKLVEELKVNWQQHDVDIEGNPQHAIDSLIEQYRELFGQIAVQASKDAVASIISQVPADQLPDSLK